MKKVFSILFAALILVSGMHLSIATHICGGKVAAVKWSVSGQKATCGMENTKQTCPSHNGIQSNCCHNKIAFFTVDNNYNSSTFLVKDIVKVVDHIFAIPVNLATNTTLASISLYTNVSPPDKSIANAVSLVDICVFRI
jgi:hypothetical protein